MDIGAGGGRDLINIKEKESGVKINLFAIENYLPNVEKLKSKNIEVEAVNIESTAFPYKEEMFDIIIMNQVLEHTKEIFWIFSEISRVIKKGGLLIIGVPNLASFHNRIALLFGKQPTSIELLGPHVRGFTKGAFKRFAEADGFFKLIGFKGSNFYPFPPVAAKILAKLLPSMAVSIFFALERTGKDGCFIEVLEKRFFETPYYRGERSE